ncbi:hypothetical protein DUNSADRAFT_10846 [Dunaliella salina]|uniref:Uncharacterized protein n=1 Tax=Dunaliella salina TaxID=3046 RepID=A0ABQ7H9Z7_DUNSA|nr:hypothetical protein DUNSADRAFT_10846 [Dunaliella salina]|eukprot:KAF5843671.1 hypothetical protein DUNSADRAFT_10846 [Dunaliella salina]
MLLLQSCTHRASLLGISNATRRTRHVVCGSLEQRFKESYTMSQVYVSEADRPKPIPASEHEDRRRRKQLLEIAEAAKRKGIGMEIVEKKLSEVETVLPGLVNLHRAKASDWVTIISDDSLANKIILLKDVFPNANVLKIFSQQPRLLLLPTERLHADAHQVKKMLSTVQGAESLVDTIPSFMDPRNLERSLAEVQAFFPGSVPLELLLKHPDLLDNLGESSIEDSAESSSSSC